ncbi:protein kinase domain protein [Ichthyophthirius multifiliis]|uniref:Protein kinase domain protein n=1 Tax=Ichthyophthirius multifiliis TaxID=5932 RepID=G0QXA6_ICHMU|nr:protein kinase domain protein [Ichthyophthirius multifiliis]EGR30147.1 protein kinase domain protein [Ichthyophthirius multifiliis]|eukprot:XP_004031383.1 protein kinase domain protein [Ichthyophthirius multifiliis]
MDKYKTIEIIGRGSFGEVTKAQNIETGEIVAIKTMKQQFSTWEECINLRELKSLRKLVNNKNIIKLKEVIRINNQLSLVFEHIDLDIFKLYEDQKKQGKRLSENQIKSIFYQIANSLQYMHKHGFFHRDLKPENILYSKKDGFIKLIDFGLAREIRSRPPYTDYVSTRWYRAPELLLHSTNYNSPVDIFALGCIICELFMLKPLFNGASEVDQIQKICTVLGTPSKLDWTEGYKLASVKGINFPQYQSIPLSSLVNYCSSEGLQLINECLRWDPQKRPTAAKILQHPYFRDIEKILPEDYFNENDENKNTQNYNVLSQKRISNYQYSSSSDANIGLGNQNVLENKLQQQELININDNMQKPPLNPGKIVQKQSKFFIIKKLRVKLIKKKNANKYVIRR